MAGPNAELVQRFWDQVHAGPDPSLLELLTSDYTRHSAHADISGPDFIAILEERVRAFPDLQGNLIDFVEEGDRVAYRWEAFGTHSQRYLNIPPTNRQVRTQGITIARIAGDRIAEEWSSWESESVLRDLNVFSI